MVDNQGWIQSTLASYMLYHESEGLERALAGDTSYEIPEATEEAEIQDASVLSFIFKASSGNLALDPTASPELVEIQNPIFETHNATMNSYKLDRSGNDFLSRATEEEISLVFDKLNADGVVTVAEVGNFLASLDTRQPEYYMNSIFGTQLGPQIDSYETYALYSIDGDANSLSQEDLDALNVSEDGTII